MFKEKCLFVFCFYFVFFLCRLEVLRILLVNFVTGHYILVVSCKLSEFPYRKLMISNPIFVDQPHPRHTCETSILLRLFIGIAVPFLDGYLIFVVHIHTHSITL